MDAPTFIQKPTVLVVDDTLENLALMSAVLKNHYEVKIANNGEKALRMVQNLPPDLILLDIMMPDMDGYAVCEALQQDPATRDIPIIFLTASNELKDEQKGFALGAVDYITKPISAPRVIARVRTHLQLKARADFLKNQSDFLAREVVKRTHEVTAVQDATILAVAMLAETRNTSTSNHIRRTQLYVKALAGKLRTHPRFESYLTEYTINTLYNSAPLHDIGNVGIPDNILLKPGRFEPHEFEIMTTHTTLGRDAIAHAEKTLGTEVTSLALAKEIVHSHHEKWDGSGYPQGLAGDAIPVSARIMAVADVYDGIVSRKVFKKGQPHEDAVRIIAESKGKHFDPDMVDAFLAIHEEFRTIASRYPDTDEDIVKKMEYLSKALAD